VLRDSISFLHTYSISPITYTLLHVVTFKQAPSAHAPVSKDLKSRSIYKKKRSEEHLRLVGASVCRARICTLHDDTTHTLNTDLRMRVLCMIACAYTVAAFVPTLAPRKSTQSQSLHAVRNDDFAKSNRCMALPHLLLAQPAVYTRMRVID
jgi:hypothetical protein